MSVTCDLVWYALFDLFLETGRKKKDFVHWRFIIFVVKVCETWVSEKQPWNCDVWEWQLQHYNTGIWAKKEKKENSSLSFLKEN